MHLFHLCSFLLLTVGLAYVCYIVVYQLLFRVELSLDGLPVVTWTLIRFFETILFLPFKFNSTSVIGISTPFSIIVCFSFNLQIQPEFMPLLQVKPEERVQNPFSMNSMETVPTGAQIGISIEPLDQLAQQTPVANATPSTLNSFVEYTQKMLDNFFNFASSFAITQAQMTPNPSESFVPLSVVQKWYDNYQRKMKNDPNFWKR